MVMVSGKVTVEKIFAVVCTALSAFLVSLVVFGPYKNTTFGILDFELDKFSNPLFQDFSGIDLKSLLSSSKSISNNEIVGVGVGVAVVPDGNVGVAVALAPEQTPAPPST